LSAKSPFKNAQGIPMCPKCKVILPDGPQFCPDCGTPLWGKKLKLRTLGGCLMMLLGPVSIFFVNRYQRNQHSLPEAGELTAAATEVTVQPHTTWYSLMQPVKAGELVFDVECRDVPVGINISPVGEDGFTPALDEKMRDGQKEIDAGQKARISLPIQAQKKYAVFVINETDKPAKASIRTTLRWGK
jgi:hypothetical protein